MKKLLPMVALSLAMTACGGGDDGESTPAASTPAAAAPSTPASNAASGPAVDLKAALPTVADFPTGWSKSTDDDDEDPEITSTSDDCTDRWAKVNATTPTEVAVAFERGGSALFQQSLDINPMQTIAQVKALVEACPTYTADSGDDSPVTITLSDLSFPAIGPQSTAFAVKFEVGGQELEGFLSLVRQGRYSISTTILEAFAPDADLLESIARKTSARLSSL